MREIDFNWSSSLRSHHDLDVLQYEIYSLNNLELLRIKIK